jgi:hypothetical protein
MADYLIDPRFRDARNAVAVAVGLALGMAVVAYALPISSLPSPQQVSVISGGIDAAEAADIMQASRNYSLEVEFLHDRQDGDDATLSGHPVTIRDGRGKAVVTSVAQGPYLLAALPPGSYTASGPSGATSASDALGTNI